MTSTIEVFKPTGILDAANGDKLRSQVIKSLDLGLEVFLIDLQDVTFMNSSGIGALVSSYSQVRKAEKKMFLCSPNSQIRLILELTAIDSILKTFENKEEFEIFWDSHR
jgi:anti-sigma B factor antagonist